MIHRRQFVATAGAATIGLALPRLAAAGSFSNNDLNWRSELIPTVPNNLAQRKPVITGVSLRPGGRQLAVVGDDHCVGIFDILAGEYSQHLRDHNDWIRSVAYSPDGNRLAAAGNDRTLRVWASDELATPILFRRHDAAIIGFAFSPNGQQIAAVGFEETMKIYDTRSGQVIHRFRCPCNDNHAVAFSADGKRIAAGGRCGTIRIWDLDQETVVANQKVHRQRIRSLAFTDDNRLISVGDDRALKILDLQNNLAVREMPQTPAKLFAMQVLGNNMVATGGSDNQVHIWDLARQQQVGVLNGHTGTVSCLDSQGDTLVSGGFDTQVRIWKVSAVGDLSPNRHANQPQWNGLK